MIRLPPFALSSLTPARSRSLRSRWTWVAVAASVLLHAAAIALLTWGPHGGLAPAAPATGEVELLMVEQKGAEPAQGGPPPHQPQPAVKPEVPKTPETAAPPPPQAPAPALDKGKEPAPAPSPPVKAAAKEPAPQPPEPKPEEKAETAEAAKPAPPVKPAPPTPQKAPVFDLSGTDSNTNAEVIGGHVLPASPDNRFRNRPPPYPEDAARRGEHGAVTVLIHVGADGSATGVEVMESSGFASLDDAAVAAVRTWHFHPALRDSEPVPFDMPFRFDFRAN